MRSLLGTTRGRLLVVGLVAIVVAAFVVVQAQQPPPAPATGEVGTLAPPRQPLIVSAAYVRNAGSESAVVAGQPVIVSAHALGETGVAALELWDGARLVAVQEADPASRSPAFYARWQWAPADAGSHILFVRAVDLQGGVVQSSAVRVRVAETIPPSGTQSLGRALALAGNGFALDVAAAPTALKYGIGVPTLQTNLQGCQLQLNVTDQPPAANGVQLLGLAPAGGNFMPLMTLTPDSSKQTQSVNLAAGGTFLFTASAFDASVVAFSPPVEVDAPDNCASGGWSGEVSLVDGKLVAPQQVDRAYLYLTQGGGAAVRVPTEQGQFVEPDGNGVPNFGPLLPAFDGSALSIEAWGRKQGSLVKLGSGSYAPAPTPTPSGGGPVGAGGPVTFGAGPAEPGGMLTTLRVMNLEAGAWPGCDVSCWKEQPVIAGSIERPALGSTKPIIKKFRWTTLLPNVNQFMWQILPYPPAKTADLAPPFMIDQGVVAVALGQSEGEFSIDFGNYLNTPIVPLFLTSDSNSSAKGTLQLLFPGLGGSASPTPTPGSGTGSQFSSAGLKSLGAFNNRFYVRIVPIELNSAMLPSNPVTLDVVEPAEPIQLPPLYETWNPNAYKIAWTYTPPVGPDPAYARCALVKAVGSDVPFPWSEIYKQNLNSGQPICYKPPSDDGWSPLDVFDAFVEFVSDVWDYISDGIDWIKDKVVNAVLVAVPCKQIASDAVCKGIANAALDGALIALGVPPTLPDFDTVVAGLKGDLATFIVESAGSIPGVAEACGLAEAGQVVSSKVKTCEEIAGAAIDEIVKQVEQARSNAAASAAGVPQWPGLVLEPDPRGIWHAPSFNVTVTRTEPNDELIPKSCSLSAWMKSTKKGWTFTELTNTAYHTKKDVTADVSGEPLSRASMIIPPLAPGESISRQLWLTQPAIWFESDGARKYQIFSATGFVYYDYFYQLKEADSHAYVLLLAGAELTFGVDSNCAQPSQQGPYVLPQGAYQY